MGDPVTIILLGLVAGFLPLHFGATISPLGSERGVRKATSLALGVLLFRVLVGLLIAVVFAGATAALAGALRNVSSFASSTLGYLKQGITSGQHAIVDGVIIVAGIVLLYQAYRRLRGRSDTGQTSEKDEKQWASSVFAITVFGIAWTATGPTQWLLTMAGVGRIQGLKIDFPGRLAVFGLFLLVSSLMLLTPILYAVLQPERAGQHLDRINETISGALRALVTAGLFFIGAYLIWRGGAGLAQWILL